MNIISLFKRVCSFISILLLIEGLFSSSVFALTDHSWMIKKYTLLGDIDFSYDWKYNEISQNSKEDFIQRYRLGVDGYVFDPRIAFFQTRGYFTQQDRLDDGSSSFIAGSANLYLFERVLNRGVFNFIPKPINLRYYTSETDSGTTQSYGIGLVYRRRGEAIKFFSRDGIISLGPYLENRYSNINNNNNNNNNAYRGFKIIFPELYFDYDRNEDENKVDERRNKQSDYYSARFVQSGERYKFTADYQKRETEGFYTEEWEYIALDHTYRNYNEGIGFIDMENRYTQSRFEGTSSGREDSRLSNRTLYYKRFGRAYDNFRINNSLSYSKLSPFNQDDYELYEGSLGSSVQKQIGKSAVNTTGVFVNFIDGEDTEQRHREGISNQFRYTFPRRLIVFQNSTVANSESGVDYGFRLGFEKTNRRIYSGEYAYDVLNSDDRKRTTHRYLLSANGNIVRNYRFHTFAEYKLVREDDINFVYDERRLKFSLDLYWNLPRGSVGVGGYYDDVRIDDSSSESGSIERLHVRGNYRFGARASGRVLALWRRNIDDLESKTLESVLLWQIRKTRFQLEYYYRDIETTAGVINEHRVVARIIRSFSRDIFF